MGSDSLQTMGDNWLEIWVWTITAVGFIVSVVATIAHYSLGDRGNDLRRLLPTVQIICTLASLVSFVASLPALNSLGATPSTIAGAIGLTLILAIIIVAVVMVMAAFPRRGKKTDSSQ